MSWKCCDNCEHHRVSYHPHHGGHQLRCALNAPKQGEELPDSIGSCGQFEPSHSVLDALQEWVDADAYRNGLNHGLEVILRDLKTRTENDKPRYREDGQRECPAMFFHASHVAGGFMRGCGRPYDHAGRCELEDQPGDELPGAQL